MESPLTLFNRFLMNSCMKHISDATSLLESKNSNATEKAIWFKWSSVTVMLLENGAQASRVAACSARLPVTSVQTDLT